MSILNLKTYLNNQELYMTERSIIIKSFSIVVLYCVEKIIIISDINQQNSSFFPINYFCITRIKSTPS